MIKRLLIMLLFVLTVNQIFSQTTNYEKIYFIKFKIYQKEFKQGVPFAEICITDKKSDFIFNCIDTDFDGYAFFHINPVKFNIDSTYLRVKLPKEPTNFDFGKVINIPINRISLLKDYNLENDIIITLIDYKILSEKEYKKHRKKYALMPGRQPSKAIDVK